MSTTDATKDLLDSFMQVVDKGDERAAKDFIIDHLNDFPIETQQKIVSAFFFDALEKEATEIERKAALQKEVLAAFDTVEKAEKNITNEQKKAELKKGLGI